MRICKFLNHVVAYLSDYRNRHRITHLFVPMLVCNACGPIIRESLEPFPLQRSHLSPTIFIDRTLYVGSRSQIRLPLINNEVPFFAHSTADDSVCYVVKRPDFIAEPMTCRLVTGAMPLD